MPFLKFITAAVSIIFAFWVGVFALFSFRYWPNVIWACVPIAFAIGLTVTSVILFRKTGAPLSKAQRLFISVFIGGMFLSCLALDVHIRHERKVLQTRAKKFLLRSIPKLLMPDSKGEVGGYYVDTNAGVANGVFGYSRVLIERYATKGRIRWSAAIQGQFAGIGVNCLNPNISDEINSNEEVRRYSAESHAILAEEWRMGFWQWIEDTMEFVSPIPEHDEEDQVHRAAQRVYGTWTNEAAESMSISDNGTFSAIWRTQNGTNVFVGNHIYRGRDSVLEVIKNKPGNPILEDGDLKELKIIHVDSHKLIYELDGHTNSMSR